MGEPKSYEKEIIGYWSEKKFDNWVSTLPCNYASSSEFWISWKRFSNKPLQKSLIQKSKIFINYEKRRMNNLKSYFCKNKKKVASTLNLHLIFTIVN